MSDLAEGRAFRKEQISKMTPTAPDRTRLQPSPIRRVLSLIAQALTLHGLTSHTPRAVLAWLSLKPTLRDSVEFGLDEAEQLRTGHRRLFCWRIH
jgi:hypothetical protein